MACDSKIWNAVFAAECKLSRQCQVGPFLSGGFPEPKQLEHATRLRRLEAALVQQLRKGLKHGAK